MRVKKTNPTPEQLSANEYAAMLFLEECRAQRRRIPTLREISAGIDLSLSATHDLVKRLIAYGYLAERVPNRKGHKRNFRFVRSVLVEKPIA